MIALTIHGATGKVGKRIIALADSDFLIVGKCSRESEKESALALADVIIDFSTAEATNGLLELCAKHKKPLVLGTTGHTADTKQKILETAKQIPILASPNFSLGVALSLQVAKKIAENLEGCRIDIVETHHIHKRDAPSGTALAFAQAVLPEVATIDSIRTGEAIGTHECIFSCQDEKIFLKHEALSRDAFARGALAAAKFLVKQPAGLYSIHDLFV